MNADTAELFSQREAEQVLADSRPPERLLSLLMLVERTVLPRRVELMGTGAGAALDLASQRLQLGVQAGNYFVIDDALAAAAPAVYKLLRRRARAVSRHDETFRMHSAALCACAARALLSFCSQSGPRFHVEAAPLEEVWAAASFSVMELYEAARDDTVSQRRGPVRAFFETVRSKTDEAWLLSQDGWVLDAPAQARGLAKYAEMTKTARELGAWRGAAGITPQLAYATRPPHEWIWCIANDTHHIALLRCPPLKWAATLNAWNDHTASDARPGDGTEARDS